jgi:hypothetical protein
LSSHSPRNLAIIPSCENLDGGIEQQANIGSRVKFWRRRTGGSGSLIVVVDNKLLGERTVKERLIEDDQQSLTSHDDGLIQDEVKVEMMSVK